MDQRENLFDLLSLLWKWRKTIVITTFLSMVVVAGLSLLLKNYYEASSIFYAAHSDLAKPSAIGEAEQKMLYYGESEDLNRTISIAKSGEIKNFLIEEFDLFERYEIDPESKHAKHKLNIKLDKLYNVTKTKYDALEITVEDLEPEFAATMVNAARNKVNDIGQKMVKQSQTTLLKSYQTNISEKVKELNALSDSLKQLREKYGIYNLLNQSSAYAELMPNIESGYLKANAILEDLGSSAPRDTIRKYQALKAGYASQLQSMKKKVALFNEGYIPVFNLEKEQKAFTEQLGVDKQRMKSLESALSTPFNAIHVVEEATTPDYKSRPRRSIIVLGFGMFIFFLSCLVILVIETIRTKTS